jgi:hypothetical protein
MLRRFVCTAFISIIATVFFTATYGTDQDTRPIRDRAAIPVKLAPVYGNEQAGDAKAAAKAGASRISLGRRSPANPYQVGSTFYDWQHNGSMARQIEHRGGQWIDVTWTYQTDVSTLRGINYQVYDLGSCVGDMPQEMLSAGGQTITSRRAGYTGIDAEWSSFCPVIGAHELDSANYFHPNAYWDACSTVPAGVFTADSPTDFHGWYQNDGTGTGDPSTDNANIWPKIEYQVGTATVLHMVTAETGGAAGDPHTISYYRRVGAYGTGNGIWSGQKVIDTVMTISPVVVADRNSDKVALAWLAPASYLHEVVANFSQYENDVWYAISTNQGAEWVANPTTSPASHSLTYDILHGLFTGGNITYYQASDPWKAYCDLAALITSDHKLHIVWGCRKWSSSTIIQRRQSAIFHWSEGAAVMPVVKAEWDSGGACYGYTWGSDVAKMTLSECDGRLYTLFTQFGSKNHSCDQIGAVNYVLSGFLYLTASSDGGQFWSTPRRVSGQPDPVFPCSEGTSGTCNSEYWASMARFGRMETCGDTLNGKNVLDILYISDKAPGGSVQPESGTWANNPVLWLRTACFTPEPEAHYTDNSGRGLGHCNSGTVLEASPEYSTSRVLTMENSGSLPNNFSIGVEYLNGGGWVRATPASGVIPAGGTCNVILEFFAPQGAQYSSIWRCQIIVTHQGTFSPNIIPACLVIGYSNPPFPVDAIIKTACKRVRVYDNGLVSNHGADASLDFVNDCDSFNLQTNSHIYLYQGTPLVSWIKPGGDTVLYTGFRQPYGVPYGFVMLSYPTMDSVNHRAYTLATTEFCTADSAIGITARYFMPKPADSCDFMYVWLNVVNRTASWIYNIQIGELLDWDVPSDSALKNGSGFDAVNKYIYQSGAEYNADGPTEALCHQKSDQRLAAIASIRPDFKNAMTIDDPTYMTYQAGDYGTSTSLPAGAIYTLMKTKSGFSAYSSTRPESTYVDLSTLATFGEFSLGPGSSTGMFFILATTKDGPTDLQGEIAKARAFSPWQYCCCCQKAGDANNDTKVGVGDAVYVINYVFKSGPKPICMPQADPNVDCRVNVGDVVFLINYIFKGGPPPQCPGDTCDYH